MRVGTEDKFSWHSCCSNLTRLSNKRPINHGLNTKFWARKFVGTSEVFTTLKVYTTYTFHFFSTTLNTMVLFTLTLKLTLNKIDAFKILRSCVKPTFYKVNFLTNLIFSNNIFKAYIIKVLSDLTHQKIPQKC
jgi:hypothetical protein